MNRIIELSIVLIAAVIFSVLLYKAHELFDRPMELHEKECVTQRYVTRSRGQMIVLCSDGGWFDTSEHNPNRDRMIEKLMEEL